MDSQSNLERRLESKIFYQENLEQYKNLKLKLEKPPKRRCVLKGVYAGCSRSIEEGTMLILDYAWMLLL